MLDLTHDEFEKKKLNIWTISSRNIFWVLMTPPPLTVGQNPLFVNDKLSDNISGLWWWVTYQQPRVKSLCCQIDKLSDKPIQVSIILDILFSTGYDSTIVRMLLFNFSWRTTSMDTSKKLSQKMSWKILHFCQTQLQLASEVPVQLRTEISCIITVTRT